MRLIPSCPHTFVPISVKHNLWCHNCVRLHLYLERNRREGFSSMANILKSSNCTLSHADVICAGQMLIVWYVGWNKEDSNLISQSNGSNSRHVDIVILNCWSLIQAPESRKKIIFKLLWTWHGCWLGWSEWRKYLVSISSLCENA